MVVASKIGGEWVCKSAANYVIQKRAGLPENRVEERELLREYKAR